MARGGPTRWPRSAAYGRVGLVGVLFSALTTEVDRHPRDFRCVFAGAIIPHDSDVAVDFHHKLEDIVNILLLPAFFAYTGMRTEIGLVSGWQSWCSAR